MLWDVPTCERIKTYKFEGPVTGARLHPRNDSLLLVSPLMATPILVDARAAEGSEQEKRPLPTNGEPSVPTKFQGGGRGMTAVFSRRGETIFAGTPSGVVLAIDTAKLEVRVSEVNARRLTPKRFCHGINAIFLGLAPGSQFGQGILWCRLRDQEHHVLAQGRCLCRQLNRQGASSLPDGRPRA